MKVFLLVIYILLLIFAPKYGIFDFKLLLFPVGLIFSYKSIIIPRFAIKTILFLFILIIYYGIIAYINNSSIDELLRYFRIILSVLLVIFLFSFSNISKNKITIALVIVLMINIFIMIINLINPSFHLFIQSIYFDNGKLLEKSNRVIGLSSGFDTSGVILLISILFLSYLYINFRTKIYLFCILISIGISFFVSRGTIIYLFLLILIFLFRSILKLKFRNIMFIFSIFLIFSIIVYPFVSKIFLSSVNLEMFGLDNQVDSEIIENQYARTDFLGMLESFLEFPKSTSGLIFGEAHDVQVDSGYIKSINQIGIIGTLFTLYANWFIYFKQKQSINSFFNFKFLLLLIIVLITFTNVKNQMLFTRGIFELYLILSFLYFKHFEKA